MTQSELCNSNIIAWEEGEPAQTLLVPEQSISTVVSTLDGQVFFLTEDGRVYVSTLKQESAGLSGKLQELALTCQCVISLACTSSHVFFVTDRGRVLRSTLATPEKVEEFKVKPQYLCAHGICEDGARLIVRELASHSHNILLISDSGKIWTINESNSQHPTEIKALKDKTLLSIASGNNFSAVLAQECPELNENGQLLKTSTDSHKNKTIYLPSCPDCREREIKSREQISEQKNEQFGVGQDTNDSNTLAQACWSKADHLVRQSALLLNSEAAKQFLNRQLSWVTGSSDLDDNQEEISGEKKDNNKVTSRMAEGVRNIGDAVNRLSRHWSNSSQEEKDKDICETLSLPNGSPTGSIAAETSPATAAPRLFRQVLGRRPKWKRQESTSLSLDCVAGGPPASAAAKSAELDQIIFAGRCLLNTSVWTWGQGKKGQLAQSDCVSRDQPTCVRSLNALGICKLVAGSFHCLALTMDGRVFAWGSNTKGQIGPGAGDLSFKCTVQEMPLPSRTSVRDIAAGAEHSLLLTTGGQVFFVGFSVASQKATMMRLSLPVHSPVHSAQFITQRIWASGSLSCCYSSVQNCGNGCPELWTEFLVSEQLFLRGCFSISHTMYDVLLPASGTNTNTNTSSARETLFRYYRQLVASIAYNIHTLLKAQCSGKDVAVLRWMDEYIQLYGCYSQALCNALVVNALHLNKTEASQLDKIFKVDKRWSGINELSPEWRTASLTMCTPLQRVMMEPLERLREYVFHLDRLAGAHSEAKDHCVAHLTRASRRYKDAATAMEAEYQKADLTRGFWDSCSSKLIDALRTPERRLIRESRSHPINLVNSGIFSSHWFIILTDVLVHVAYSGHVVYPLNTIWVEPLQDAETQNCLVLTMPEESLNLCCPTGKDKIEWFTSLQSAISTSLASTNDGPLGSSSSSGSISSINSISSGSSPVKSNRSSPPLARFASYVFTKSAMLKDVSYKGYWFCGKMHGVGELRWPDGRVYNGNLRQNMQYGYGVSETPGPSGTYYEGNWKDGKMAGYGTLRYANSDVYEGYFQDNQPHGHGTLKRGHFLTSAADVYVGQWDSGQKHGYGVMDDIVAGEKYMGMWQGDAKHGSAVLVTLDGLYIEGCFNNNKMTGQCVMLLEDGTSYEGEVAGVGILGGKGLMRLPNGDVIRGAFHGSWADGVKINATFTKASPASTSNSNAADDKSGSSQAVTNQYYVPAKRKWEAIFRQCSHSLGLPLVNAVWVKEDTWKAWEQIAIIVCQHVGKTPADVAPLRRNGSGGSKADVSGEKRSEVSEVLQRIPEYGRELLDQQQLGKIETYLQMAVDWNAHPLGRMIDQLVDVYRSTYVGVGAHPRLLPHAVEEVHSFVRRIYAYVRLLFPALPPEDRPTYINSSDTTGDDSNNSTMVSASSLLLPMLLPRVYPPLFTLYVLHNERQDEPYWERLLKWNKQSDLALMNFLAVDSKFYEEEICDGHFSDAVDCLQQISTTFSPKEKLLVIQATFHAIKSLNQSHLGSSYVLSMDDLFPLFQFVVVRARIRNLGSEIQLIEDFIEHPFISGELDMMFTIVKAAYHYIQHEKMSFT